MAYSTSNPPVRLCGGIGSSMSIWGYKSADGQTDVRVAGYFTNGYDLGMRAGDIVFAVDTDTYAGSMHIVNAATASSVDLNDGVAIAATDSD